MVILAFFREFDLALLDGCNSMEGKWMWRRLNSKRCEVLKSIDFGYNSQLL